MLKASSSILCRNLTIGASSTSVAAAAVSSVAVSTAISSNSKSPPLTSVSIASLADFVIFRDDPVHAHLGGKLDFFSRFLVGRVCRCDDQAITAFAQYDDAT